MSASADAVDNGYWRTNLKLVTGLLVVWFLVSYGMGILWVEPLNATHIGGFPLGFWFAQQGSILVFIALILTYCLVMDRVDAAYSEPVPVAVEQSSPVAPSSDADGD